MADTVSTIKRVMAAAGAPADMIERALHVLEEDRRALQRARKARWNEKNVTRNAKNVPNVKPLKDSGNGNARNVPNVLTRDIYNNTSPITPPYNSTLVTSESLSRARARGTRIDPNFRPSERDWEKLKAETGFGQARMELETRRMRDYYEGNGKLQKDWNATWRNWMRSPLQATVPLVNGKRPMSARQAARAEIFEKTKARAERIENGQFSGVEGMGAAQGGVAGAGSGPHPEPITRFGFRCRADSEDAG